MTTLTPEGAHILATLSKSERLLLDEIRGNQRDQWCSQNECDTGIAKTVCPFGQCVAFDENTLTVLLSLNIPLHVLAALDSSPDLVKLVETMIADRKGQTEEAKDI